MNVRFKTINFDKPLDVDSYELPDIPAGKYVVDDSCFIPMSEAVAQLGANNVASEKFKNYYDFPTGTDDGREIPFSRRHDAKDIAEISDNIYQETKDIADKLEKDKAAAKRRKAFDDRLKAATPSTVNQTSSTSE